MEILLFWANHPSSYKSRLHHCILALMQLVIAIMCFFLTLSYQEESTAAVTCDWSCCHMADLSHQCRPLPQQQQLAGPMQPLSEHQLLDDTTCSSVYHPCLTTTHTTLYTTYTHPYCHTTHKQHTYATSLHIP